MNQDENSGRLSNRKALTMNKSFLKIYYQDSRDFETFLSDISSFKTAFTFGLLNSTHIQLSIEVRRHTLSGEATLEGHRPREAHTHTQVCLVSQQSLSTLCSESILKCHLINPNSGSY